MTLERFWDTEVASGVMEYEAFVVHVVMLCTILMLLLFIGGSIVKVNAAEMPVHDA
jgi:hypothetical protein